MSEGWDKLAEPFPPGEIQWRVEALSKDKRRAMVVPYVDARTVLDRLDEAVGPDGWQDGYEVLKQEPEAFAVKCRLSLMDVAKEDVGEGDSLKAAFSDALKRAAVKFGVGRYLYRMDKHWVDHDPETGRFEAPTTAPASTSGAGQRPEASTSAAQTQPQPEPAAEAKPEPQELIDRLMDHLKEAGLGRQAAQIVTKYGGYGKNLDESRKVYGELRALLKRQGAQGGGGDGD